MAHLVLKYPTTDTNKLERWLGREPMDRLASHMKGWYYLPIQISGVPGHVSVGADGSFSGRIRGVGEYYSAYDRLEDMYLAARRRWRNAARSKQLNMGFASFNDLIAKATTGGRQDLPFQKAGSTGVIAVTNSLWRLGNQPSAGATPAAAPGGTAQSRTTAGALAQQNPTSGTQHFLGASPVASVAGNTLLLYDQIFGVAKTMNSTSTEAVTGVPTRYQSASSNALDYAGGNFLFVQVGGTALAATAHNWTVCTYTDQDGNTGATLPSLTGNSGAIVDRLDHPTSQWFAPLAAGDTGIKALTQMQCSALVVTGVIWFMMGHPIAWMPCPIVNLACPVDGLSTPLNLARIFDDACLAFLEVSKPATTATTYNGSVTTVSG